MADDALDADWAAALDEQRTTEEDTTSSDTQTEKTGGFDGRVGEYYGKKRGHRKRKQSAPG